MKNDFTNEVYQAWCVGRCGGTHLPYANILLASVVDKNGAESQVRVDDDLTQQKIDAMNQNLGAKLDVITTALNTANRHLAQIEENTTPVPVKVELIGFEGLYPFELPREQNVPAFGKLYFGDGYRGLVGNVIMSNGAKIALKPSDFSADKIEALNAIDVAEDGDIKVGCGEGAYDGNITYHYNDALSATVNIECSYPSSFRDIKQTQIDLANITVGQTIDFTADDLIGSDDAGHEVILPTVTPECNVQNQEIIIVWESNNNDVLAPVEGQQGKFYATKAGMATITYKYNAKSFGGDETTIITATFNAEVV